MALKFVAILKNPIYVEKALSQLTKVTMRNVIKFL
jgi:hypothetical protein